jgi:quercetin dioxygenase-like cupin family protein
MRMPLVIGPDQGTPLGGAFEVVVKVRGEDTNGVMAAIEETVPAHRLVRPHTHENDVWVYVLVGEVGILVGDRIEFTTAGGWALKPRNVVHAMWNRGDSPARIIEVLTPAGTERWFEETATLAQGDSAGFEAACARHGIHFFSDSPWIDELGRRFGVA